MASVKCWNTKCKNNGANCCCKASGVEITVDGSCDTYEEIDIYKEVEGFSRDE